jgi:hypothetical protein
MFGGFHMELPGQPMAKKPKQPKAGRCQSADFGISPRGNAHTELRAKRQRSAREAIYRNRPIEPMKPMWKVPGILRLKL